MAKNNTTKIPRANYGIMRKGGPHKKSNGARRKTEKQKLMNEARV